MLQKKTYLAEILDTKTDWSGDEWLQCGKNLLSKTHQKVVLVSVSQLSTSREL